MDDETQERLEQWWLGLTDEQRAELLPLEEGDVLPSDYVADLIDVLGIGPLGTPRWAPGRSGTFDVHSRVAGFLAERRAETGGG